MPEKDDTRRKIIVALTKSQDALYNYLFLRVGNDEDAREILQETNVSIWKKLDTVDSPEHFLPWAKTLASFEIKKFFTQRKRDGAKVIFDSETADTVAATLQEPEHEKARYDEIDYRMLKHCLGQLPPQKGRLVTRRYWDGCSVHEIAAEEGQPYSRVAVQLLRARKALGDCIRRLRCRFRDDAEPAPDETARAELLETAFDADFSGAAELRRAFVADSVLRGEWLETASVHAAIVFHLAQLRSAFPHGLRPPARQARSRRAALAAALAAAFVALLGGAVFGWRSVSAQGRKTAETALPQREALAVHPPDVVPPVVSKTLQTQKEIKMKTQTLAKAAAVAVAAAAFAPQPAATVQAATAGETAVAASSAPKSGKAVVCGSAGSPVQTIDTRDAAGEGVPASLETRDCDGQPSNPVHKTIDTSKPLGTVVMLI